MDAVFRDIATNRYERNHRKNYNYLILCGAKVRSQFDTGLIGGFQEKNTSLSSCFKSSHSVVRQLEREREQKEVS
jgi:hypothetical protein